MAQQLWITTQQPECMTPLCLLKIILIFKTMVNKLPGLSFSAILTKLFNTFNNPLLEILVVQKHKYNALTKSMILYTDVCFIRRQFF